MRRKGPLWTIEGIASKGAYNYAVVYGHPNATSHHYVLEHRIVMENHIGRILDRKEIVHHKDDNKKNNDISNLELISSASKHGRLHGLKVGMSFSVLKCPYCECLFERWTGNTSKFKGSKYTFCSRRCNAKFYKSDKSKKPFVGNLVKSAKKFANFDPTQDSPVNQRSGSITGLMQRASTS